MRKTFLGINLWRRVYHQMSPPSLINHVYRRKLIDCTTQVAEKLELSTCTVHLAVKLLDYFMDGHDIQVCHVYVHLYGSSGSHAVGLLHGRS